MRVFSYKMPIAAQYAIAFGAIAAALAARRMLDPLLGDSVPFVTLFAVMLPLVLLVRPAPFLLASGAGLLGAWYFFIPERFSFRLANQAGEAQLILAGAAICGATVAAWLSSRAYQRAEEGERVVSENLRCMTLLRDISVRCAVDGHERQKRLEEVLDAAIMLTKADKGNIQILDSESASYIIASQRGFDGEFLRYFERVHARSASVCGAAADSGRRVVVDDVRTSALFAAQDSRRVLLEAGVHAVQTTPLISSTGKVVGMISTHFARAGPLESRELEWLDVLARQAADYLERLDGDQRMSRALEKRTLEVRQAEQGLARSERMAAVGSMAAGLAHDIGNILIPLSARLETLVASSANLDPEAREDLEVVVSLIELLREMARNLSLFARDPEREGSEGSTDLTQWVEKTQGLMRASLGPRGRGADIQLQHDVPDSIPVLPVAPHRLTQAVLNLVLNARDAIEAAGRPGVITIRARADVDSSSVRLSVVDNGCGMDEATVRRCIEPFFTTKHTGSGQSGTGLGLSLAQTVCTRAGGRLYIRSKVGSGTEVTLEFPGAHVSVTATSKAFGLLSR